MLIEALALIDAPPPAYLVGGGPLRGPLTWLIRARGLEAVVHLPGWSYEPTRYIAQATVHVAPSREESWSQSAVLPLGLGVSVVGTAVDGLARALGEGRGVLVPPEDPPRPRRGAVTRPGRRAPRPRPRPGLRPAVHPQRSGPRYTLAPSGAGSGRVGFSPDRDGRAYGPPGHSAPICVQRERPNRPRKHPLLRVGRRRSKQGECRDEHFGCLAGPEPAGEGEPPATAVLAAVRPAVLPGGIAAWTGSSSFSILSFLSPRC